MKFTTSFKHKQNSNYVCYYRVKVIYLKYNMISSEFVFLNS